MEQVEIMEVVMEPMEVDMELELDLLELEHQHTATDPQDTELILVLVSLEGLESMEGKVTARRLWV